MKLNDFAWSSTINTGSESFFLNGNVMPQCVSHFYKKIASQHVVINNVPFSYSLG